MAEGNAGAGDVGRRRPRGARPRGEDLPGAIVAATRTVVATVGVRAASVRAIATHAGVDPALVHYYFGTKEELVARALMLPDDRLAAQFTGWVRRGELDELVSEILAAWEDPDLQVLMMARLRHVIEDDRINPVHALLHRAAGVEVIDAHPVPDAGEANVAAALVGFVLARYALRIEPLASADLKDVAARWRRGLRALLRSEDDEHQAAPAGDAAPR